MAAQRHAARVICVHNTVARRSIDVRICDVRVVFIRILVGCAAGLVRGPLS
jgi:hypothetical protein